MNTLDAFIMGDINRHKEKMVFDWDEAARLILSRKPKTVFAGLQGDWEYTGGMIYSDGKPITDKYTYLSSTWATPEIKLDEEVLPCYRMKHEVPEWDASTKWPKSSLEILERMED